MGHNGDELFVDSMRANHGGGAGERSGSVKVRVPRGRSAVGMRVGKTAGREEKARAREGLEPRRIYPLHKSDLLMRDLWPNMLVMVMRAKEEGKWEEQVRLWWWW